MDNADRADSRVQTMIDTAIANRVRYAGESARECIDCEEPIPQARRDAIPGCQRCVDCEEIAARRKGG